MAVYLITAKRDHSQAMIEKLDSFYPNDNYISVTESSWLINEKERITPKAIFEKMFGDSNEVTHLIVPVDSYYGVHNNDVWNWITSKGL